jgi:hypothetical protein
MKKIVLIERDVQSIAIGTKKLLSLERVHLRAKTKILTYEEKITFILIQDSGMEVYE